MLSDTDACSMGERRRAKLERRRMRARRQTVWKEDDVKDSVEAAFIETTNLDAFSALTEAYRPEPLCVYYEAVVRDPHNVLHM